MIRIQHTLGLAVAGMALAAAGTALAADKVQIGNGQMEFPESVTSTADGTLYAGSLTQGVIFKAASGATTSQVWAQKPAEGAGAVIGVFADEAQGTLWACYADLAAFAGGPAMPSVLRAYDIASGSEKSSYTFPDASFCNDIATTADGTAYAADTSGARIMRIAPGASDAETWFTDPQLAGVDGISFASDGELYVNNVMTNKIFRVEMGSDGKAEGLTEITTSQPLMGPDGMRFGDDGKLYVAENGAGQVDALTLDGDSATVKVLQGGYNAPTAVTKVGNTLWALEAKIGMLGGEEDPGMFYAYPVALDAAQ